MGRNLLLSPTVYFYGIGAALAVSEKLIRARADLYGASRHPLKELAPAGGDGRFRKGNRRKLLPKAAYGCLQESLKPICWLKRRFLLHQEGMVCMAKGFEDFLRKPAVRTRGDRNKITASSGRPFNF